MKTRWWSGKCVPSCLIDLMDVLDQSSKGMS